MHRPFPIFLVVLIGSVAAAVTARVSAGGAIVITPLAQEGDVVPGVGTITRIDGLAINVKGDWTVEADTDHGNSDADAVVLFNGDLFVREGNPIAPAGASIGGFDAINISASGNNGWNFFLDGVANNSGVYFKTTLLIQEGDVSTAPQFGAGTVYLGFFDAKINDGNEVLVLASVDDPTIPGTTNRALVLLDVSDIGELMSQTVVAKAGDVLVGQTEPIDDFQTGGHDTAFNNNNVAMYIADLAGNTAVDGAIYLGNTLLAQEGSASPAAGRNYLSLATGVVDLNNNGDYVFRALLDGDTATNTIIVHNGVTFRQEGDVVSTARGSFALTSLGSGPVAIADTNDVLWYGDWDDPNTDVDSGLFLNDALLVQEGVTMIGGVAIDTIPSGDDGFAISDDGRFVVFEATLDDGTNGAFGIELPEDCVADIADVDSADPNGTVNVFDLLELLNNWTTNGPGAAIAKPIDVVDVFDLLELLAAWGDC